MILTVSVSNKGVRMVDRLVLRSDGEKELMKNAHKLKSGQLAQTDGACATADSQLVGFGQVLEGCDLHACEMVLKMK